MRKTTTELSDGLSLRPSSAPPETCAQSVEEDSDEDFEAGFNPAWMVPDHAGRFHWFKKKQREGSLTHTPRPHHGNGDDEKDHQQPETALAKAADHSSTSPSMAEAAYLKHMAVDVLPEGVIQWAEANSGVCDEHPRKGDIPLLERDDSFSRLLARARLPGKRTRESPIPDTHMPPPPSPLPLPGRAKDTSREIISAGQQSSVFQPPPPPPLSPVFGGLGAKPWKDRSAELETFSAPDIRGQCASESLSPMLDAVVPTAGPVSPSTEPARPKRQPQQHIPPRFWSASTTNTEPDKQQRLTYNTAPRESSPARFCSLRQVTPADKWSMLNAAVAVMPPPPPVGRAAPGGRQRPARDRTQQRDPSAMRLRTKFYEKRVWERSPVPEEATVPAGPPLLSLPLPRVPPLAAPTAKRQSPTNLSRRDMREGEFSPFSEEFLALPSPSSQTESPPYGYPQSKRARDGAAVGTARRQMRPSSPPCQPQDVQSAGWSQERTSTGAPFWFNRITGQLSNQKPACFATSQ